MIEAYPLSWPIGESRTPKHQIKHSRFKTTLGRARDYVKEEIRRIGGTLPIISTNIPTKANGDLYADWGRYKIDDAGVAVYFTYNGKQVCLCCDSYRYVLDNLHAIGRTIEALRQISRDGVSDFLNKTFTGFKAISEKSAGPSCWDILGIAPTTDKNAITSAYRQKAILMHPDNGGSAESFAALAEARNQADKISSKL